MYFRAKRDSHMMQNKYYLDNNLQVRRSLTKSKFLNMMEENSKPLRESEGKIAAAIEDKIQNIYRTASIRSNFKK